MSPFSKDDVIKLVLEPRTYVAGERLMGVVELDLKKAHENKIERVVVRLRGVAHTHILQKRSRANRKTPRPQGKISISNITLIREGLMLWERGTYPVNAQVVQLPFSFDLPASLPGSFRIRMPISDHRGDVVYGVEVLVDLPGLLQKSCHLKQTFALLPATTDERVVHASQLFQGWAGDWSLIEKEHVIRRGMWGAYSCVKAEFQLPALSSFPIGIPFPVALVVTTTTKPMVRSDATPEILSAYSNAPLFPAPPSGPQNVQIQLRRRVHLEAPSCEAIMEEGLEYLGGFGTSTKGAKQVVQTTHAEPVWIPEDADAKSADAKGQWKRQVRFDTTIQFDCSPTADSGIIRPTYEIAIKVPFPGLENNLTWNIPIHINSGVRCFDPNVPLPTLGLPSSYFSKGGRRTPLWAAFEVDPHW